MSFSMLYFSMAWVAQSTASCCMSSDISAFLITAFLSVIYKQPKFPHVDLNYVQRICQSNTALVAMVIATTANMSLPRKTPNSTNLISATSCPWQPIFCPTRPINRPSPRANLLQEIGASDLLKLLVTSQ